MFVLKSKPTSLLDLPAEVRNNIYDLCIPSVRLCRFAIKDPEYIFDSTEFCTPLPALLFTCSQIYNEAIGTLYARATLAIEPCQQYPTDCRNRNEFLGQYAEDYAFCPSPLLQRIKSVHVYSTATWLVDQDAFQALFLWLIPNTSVRGIWLSRKSMQQWRHIECLINLDGLTYTKESTDAKTRAIDVFARRICPRLRIYRCGNSFPDASVTLRSLEIQTYSVCTENDISQLHLNRDQSFLAKDRGCDIKKDLIIRNHNRLVDRVFEDPLMKSAYRSGSLGLFQSILIQE